MELYITGIICQTQHGGCELNWQFSQAWTQPYLCFVPQHWKPLAVLISFFLCLFICAWNCMYSLCITFCHAISIFVHSTLNPSLGPICCLWRNGICRMSPWSSHIVLIIMIAWMPFRFNSHMLELLLWLQLLLLLIVFNLAKCWTSNGLSKATPDWVM